MSKPAEGMCRCCLGSAPTEYIFNKPSKMSIKEDIPYSDMINACSSFPISTEDGLPHYICTSCVTELHQAFKFREKCDESFKKLKKLLFDTSASDKLKIPNIAIDDIFADTKENSSPEDVLFDADHIFDDKIKLEVDSDESCDGGILNSHSNENSEGAKVGLAYSFDTKEFIPKHDEMQPFIRMESLNIKRISGIRPIKTGAGEKCSLSKRRTKVRQLKVCESCGAEFRKKSELKAHYLSLHPELCFGKYSCKLCNKPYSRKSEHDSMHHPELLKEHEPIACPICQHKFSTKTLFAIHFETHSDVRNYKCTECDATFKQYVGLFKHRLIHQEKQFKCETCSKEFTSKYKLCIHIRSHTKEKPYKCGVCSKAYSTGNQRNMHMASKHPDAEYQGFDKEILGALLALKVKKSKSNVCNYCGKTYYRKSDLEDHMNKHIGVKPYYCDICKKDYYSKRRHMSLHNRRKKSYQCEVCDKTFTTEQYLKAHMFIHSSERTFVCGECGATFKQNSSLYTHKKLHEEKEFICHYCSKPFTTKYKLQIHIRTHTNEKPFECDECDLKFVTGNLLNTHKLRHGTNRHFACHHCDKQFKTNSDRRQHLKVHEMVRKYPCKMCDKKFFRSDHRNRHEMTVHALDSSKLEANS